MARLAKGAETSISMAFLVMCAEIILRLLRLFFVFYSAWFCLLAEARILMDGAYAHLAAFPASNRSLHGQTELFSIAWRSWL
jgi:hypothetical protein